MAKKLNIGKDGDTFKIAEDGTIIRVDENKQPDNPKSNGKGWLWFLLIVVIAGIAAYAVIMNLTAASSDNYELTVDSSGDNNVIVEELANEDFDSFLSKFANSSVFQKERTTVSTGNWTFEENFFGEGYVYIDGETYCGSWSNSENKRVYKIGWCGSELFAKLTFTNQNGLWYLSGFIEYDNNY
jgi:hypothetical protein